MGCELSRSGRWPGLVAVGLGLVMAMVSGPAARAEGVLDRVARSGQLRLIGPVDHPPLLSLDAQGRPIRDAAAVPPGSEIVTRLERGELRSRTEGPR